MTDNTELVSYDEYKGNKMIVLKKDEATTFPFKFGKAKAQLIVSHFDAIKQFAREDVSPTSLDEEKKELTE